jgi:protein tyrosine/serine phosphatase
MLSLRLAAFYVIAFRAVAATTVPGVPDFAQVDDRIFRGHQPSREGLENLSQMGIKTLIDLRGGWIHAPREKKLVESLGMKYVSERFSGIFPPKDKQIAKLMKVLEDPDAGPIFVHCRRGADRAGVLIACYRMIHYHWTNAKALEEARKSKMSFLEVLMLRYVRNFNPATCVEEPSHPATHPNPGGQSDHRP